MIYATLKQDFSGLNRIENMLPHNVEKSVRKVAQAVIADINASWSSSSPSDNGAPPAVVSGNLRDSITDAQARDELGHFTAAWKISVEADYAGYLEPPGWLNRPFLLPALERAEQHLGYFFEGVFDGADDGGDE